MKDMIKDMIKGYLYRLLLPLLLLAAGGNAALAGNICPEGAFEGEQQRPKVALVLCGGGAKGAAHIGVLKVLEEVGMPVDMIVGTSIGGLVGGMYAMGYDAEQLDSIVAGCDWKYLLSDNTSSRRDASFAIKSLDSKYLLRVPFYGITTGKGAAKEDSPISRLPAGLISGQNVLNFLNGLSMGYQEPMDFNDLPVPFACVAADLSTGQPVVLDEGILPVAMRATMAIPGVFAPVDLDGRVLVDGGIINKFPVDVARKKGADIVIGVDIQNDDPGPENLRSIPQVLNQMIGLMGRETYLKNVADVDILIKPDVSEYGTYSFNKAAVEQLMINGREAAQEKYAELEKLARQLNSMDAGAKGPDVPKATEVVKDTFCFKSVEIRGIEKENEHWLKRVSGLRHNVKLSGSDINRGVSILMGTKAFSSVTYTVVNKGNDDESLVVNVKKGPANLLAVGARYDSEEAAAILVHMGLGEYKLLGSKLGVTARLSYNPYGEIDYSYTSKDFPKIGLSYRAGGEDMNIYKSTRNQDNLSFRYQRVQLKLSNIYLRNFNFEGGARYEYFDFSKYLKYDLPPEYEAYKVKDEGFLGYYVEGRMDSRDDSYFATRGMTFDAEGTFYHSNFKSGFEEFGAVRIDVGGAISLAERLVLLPQLYGRAIIGTCTRVPFLNYIGGMVPGRYFRQQLPFVGVPYAIVMDNTVAIARLDLRQRIGEKHYIYGMANYLATSHGLDDLLAGDSAGMWGAGIKYSYNSPIGPLSFNLHWSDYEHKVGAYVSLGHYF